MSVNEEAQDDELLALASIYDENTFTVAREGKTASGRFVAQLEMTDQFYVTFTLNQGCETDDTYGSKTSMHCVKYLPPVTLYFKLPPDYPSHSAPQFTLSCKWLTIQQLSSLCQKLDEIWEEYKGEVVLFLWTSFLKDDVLEYMDIHSPLDLSFVVGKKKVRLKRPSAEPCQDSADTSDTISSGSVNEYKNGCECSNIDIEGAAAGPIERAGHACTSCRDPRAIQNIASQELLLPTILEHDKAQRDYVFKTILFTCRVCFQEKLGALGMKFPGCEHVYCKECMRSYFQVQIHDGNVQGMTCPSHECESQAHPAQVKELVGPELFSRYDQLLLQSSLDTMSDVMYCPRKACGSAVLVEPESNMGRCPGCHYVFCIYCKLVSHGISPCRIQADEIKKLRLEYLNSNEFEKKIMERRYGRRAMAQIIEDSFTQEWLEEYSKQCPSCGAHIQKIDGCNKMTCTKCRSYFCWLCMSPLSKGNPYAHFNSPSYACFNKLFYGVVTDDFDNEWQEIL